MHQMRISTTQVSDAQVEKVRNQKKNMKIERAVGLKKTVS
jgi:hypothetical protein